MALQGSWRTVLCCGSDGMVQMRKSPPPEALRDWIETELGGTRLGDTRLTARLLQMTGMFYAKPSVHIPQACGSASNRSDP